MVQWDIVTHQDTTKFITTTDIDLRRASKGSLVII